MIHDLHDLLDQLIRAGEAHKLALIAFAGWFSHIFIPKFCRGAKWVWCFLAGKGTTGILLYIRTGFYINQTASVKETNTNENQKPPNG